MGRKPVLCCTRCIPEMGTVRPRVGTDCESSPAIIPGELVAVEAHTVFVWSVRFGFLYTTTSLHVEERQERFVLEFNADSGCVSYSIEAVSRPRHGFGMCDCGLSSLHPLRYFSKHPIENLVRQLNRLVNGVACIDRLSQNQQMFLLLGFSATT